MISINMIRMKFIVQLDKVEVNATTWLNTLRTVINLTTGVAWTDFGEQNQYFGDNHAACLFY